MANKQHSYDYTNTIRDMDGVFSTLVAKSPTILKLIGTGAPAKSKKVEWLDDELSETTFTIASFDTDGDGTGINFASTTGMAAGDILYFTSSTGAVRAGAALIASVDDTTDITITRDYGEASETLATLVVGDIAYLQDPKEEGFTYTASAGREPSAKYNYTQIFTKTATLSRTATQSAVYGINENTTLESLMDYQIGIQMKKLLWELNRTVIRSEGKPRTGTTAGLQGTMYGIWNKIKGGNATAVGGAISYDSLNDAFQSIYDDGGISNNYAMVMNVNQARKISALNVSGTNPMIQLAQSVTQTVGQATTQYVSDFRPLDGGYGGSIVIDRSMHTDQIMILDMNKIKFRYMQPLIAKDTTLPTADAYSSSLLTEVTLEIKNAATAHAVLTGLTV